MTYFIHFVWLFYFCSYDIYLNGEVKLNNASLGIGGVYTLLVVDYNNNTEVGVFL